MLYWSKLYYKLKYTIEKKHIKKIIGNSISPVYDKKKKHWYYNDGDDFIEQGDIKYILGEYVGEGLLYCYRYKGCNPEYGDHAHCFESVLEVAFRHPFSFYIDEEYKEQYSEQELDLINKVIKKRRIDIRKQRGIS